MRAEIRGQVQGKPVCSHHACNVAMCISYTHRFHARCCIYDIIRKRESKIKKKHIKTAYILYLYPKIYCIFFGFHFSTCKYHMMGLVFLVSQKYLQSRVAHKPHAVRMTRWLVELGGEGWPVQK